MHYVGYISKNVIWGLIIFFNWCNSICCPPLTSLSSHRLSLGRSLVTALILDPSPPTYSQSENKIFFTFFYVANLPMRGISLLWGYCRKASFRKPGPVLSSVALSRGKFSFNASIVYLRNWDFFANPKMLFSILAVPMVESLLRNLYWVEDCVQFAGRNERKLLWKIGPEMYNHDFFVFYKWFFHSLSLYGFFKSRKCTVTSMYNFRETWLFIWLKSIYS